MFDGESLDVRIEERAGASIVAPQGDVDLSSSPELRTALQSALRTKPARLVIDLSLTPSMDSSAIATLIEAMRLSKSAGVPLRLAAIQPRVQSVLEIARLTTVFDIRESVDEALEG
jgi:anti-sigma B factor antagonist